MKAIDLHIHTVSTKSDSKFNFSMEALKEYVSGMELDIIGITNHNTFDLNQFKMIDESLDIKVLPGIEIDFERGHLLLLAENEDLNDFSNKCKEVERQIPSSKEYLDTSELIDIFGDLNKYLLIPHNPKKPKVSKDVIRNLSNYISAVEVSSIKDFLKEHKENREFVPLWFSDIRACKQQNTTEYGRTYLDIEQDSISSIKMALLDREKVKLSIEESNQLFPITSNGLQISSGLNILMGFRSSGKSYFLNEINRSNENIKYIEQFSLIDKHSANVSEFNVRLSNENSTVEEKRFFKYKGLIEDIHDVDIVSEEKKINNYIESLKKFALEEERRDSFSKAKLFTQSPLVIQETDSLDKLISGLEVLIENKEYRNIIDEHISMVSLKELIVNLSKRAINLNEDKFFKEHSNQVIGEIQNQLQVHTSSNKIENVNFRDYIFCKDRIEKFNYITNLVKTHKESKIEKISKFDLIMKTGEYNNVSEIKSRVKTKLPLSDMFKNSYHEGYSYLQELKNLGVSKVDYYKYFVNVKFDIVNEYNLPASGGERAEYNLLNEIKSASNHDILLIDEPESSFDNIFLNKEVNEMIKNISKKMPVILATHNSTVGLSISPDYLLYAERDTRGRTPIFELYGGKPDAEYLTSKYEIGKEIKTEAVLMDLLEAGEDAYKGRKIIYELHKNRR